MRAALTAVHIGDQPSALMHGGPTRTRIIADEVLNPAILLDAACDSAVAVSLRTETAALPCHYND